MTSTETRRWQRFLNRAGKGPPLLIDGRWGAQTSLATKRFQASAGLAETRALDTATLVAAGAAGYVPAYVASPAVFDEIHDEEGVRLDVYDDGAGNLTVGIGHKLTKEELASGLYPLGAKITLAKAKAFFLADIAWVVEALNDAITAPLNQNQVDACLDFIYNDGPACLYQSLGKALNAQRFDDVPSIMKLYIHNSRGEEDERLKKRRAREIALFTKPVQTPTLPSIA